MDLGLKLVYDSEDYEGTLLEMCYKENSRPPIYSPVINSTNNAIRCKAIGANAIG